MWVQHEVKAEHGRSGALVYVLMWDLQVCRIGCAGVWRACVRVCSQVCAAGWPVSSVGCPGEGDCAVPAERAQECSRMYSQPGVPEA